MRSCLALFLILTFISQAYVYARNFTFTFMGGQYKGEAYHFNNVLLPHGQGVFVGRNSNYVGRYFRGERSGEGVYKTSVGFNSLEYKGSFLRDLCHGYGVLLVNNTISYSGNWVYSRRSGHGFEKSPNGDTYFGEFFNDFFHGEGTAIFSTGEKYIGNFSYSKKSGFGTFITSENERYVGQFLNNLKHGPGTFYFSDGTVSHLNYKNNTKQGLETIKYTDGRIETQFWKDGKRAGEQIIRYSDGRIETRLHCFSCRKRIEPGYEPAGNSPAYYHRGCLTRSRDSPERKRREPRQRRILDDHN